jgi:hypothetical protein
MIHRLTGVIAALACLGIIAFAGAAAVASVATRQDVTAAPAYHAPPAPVQPLAYSHKQHLAQGLQCEGCHATARTDARATLPPTTTCMACHATVKTDSADIQKLKEFDAKKTDIPWVRVYRLPEYVYFSHQIHVSATPSVTCDVCHGNVPEMDRMQKVRDISMAACVECHKQRAARVGCDTCHEPRG